MNRAPRELSPLIAGERDVFTTEFPLLAGEAIVGIPAAQMLVKWGADQAPQESVLSVGVLGAVVSILLEGRVGGNNYVCRVVAQTSLDRVLAEEFAFTVLA